MALEAAKAQARKHNLSFAAYELREIVAESALFLADDVDVETTISLRPYTEGTRGSSDSWNEFKIHSWTSKRGWTQHCRGLIRVRSNIGDTEHVLSGPGRCVNDLMVSRRAEIEAASVNTINKQHLYKVLSNIGAHYGQTFQGLENCHADCHHSHADLYVRDTTALMPKEFQPELTLHPAFLDGLLQLVWPILGQGRMELDTLYMPTLIKHAMFSCSCPSAPGDYVKVHGKHGTGSSHLSSPAPTQFNLFASSSFSSETLITLNGLVMTPIRDSGPRQTIDVRKLCYKLQWEPLSTVQNVSLCNDPVQSHGAASPNHCLPHINSVSDTNSTANQPETVKFIATPPDGIHMNGHENGVISIDSCLTDDNCRKDTALNGYQNNCKFPVGNPHHTTEDSRIILVSFGLRDNGMMTTLADVLNIEASYQRQMDTFERMQCVDKTVIIVQSPTASLRDMNNAEFYSIQFILLNAARTLWVYQTTSPDSQLTIGLIRSVRSESMVNVTTLGLETQDACAASDMVFQVLGLKFPANGAEGCSESEFKFQGSELLVPRAVEDNLSNFSIHKETSNLATALQPFHQRGRRFKMHIQNPGSLDTLYFADDSVGTLGESFVEVEIKATGINFKDIVVCMGQLNQPYMGVECSGVVKSVGRDVTDVKIGQRVMCVTEGSYSTYARCLATSTVTVPDRLSFEEAASIPVAYCTAYYSLFDLGKLSRSEKVLIHAGAGGVGQAAIQLAQMVGADILVTVGSQDKKKFLMENYHIPEGRIFYSRDTSFGNAIRTATNNEGLDVILNSLAGDLLRESWECIAPFGRFIEIGKADITNNSRLEMLKFEENVTFSSVDLTKVAKYRPHLMKRLLNDVCKLIDSGFIKPIFPITKYRISEVETAFRMLQTGKNIGKAVVVPYPEDQVKVRQISLIAEM